MYVATNLIGVPRHAPHLNLHDALAENTPLAESSPQEPLRGTPIATEALWQAQWPCRLFMVLETAPMDGPTGTDQYLFASGQVTREVEAHQVFGPQGAEVAELLSAVSRLKASQASALAQTWEELHGSHWLLPSAVAATARSEHRGGAWTGARNAIWETSRHGAWRAAGNAALGLIMRDLIDTRQHKELMTPWREVMGD